MREAQQQAVSGALPLSGTAAPRSERQEGRSSMTTTERREGVGFAISLTVILVLAILIALQAARIVATERAYNAEQAQQDRCSDLGEWGADCND
jgi:histidine ammonia-lyase